MPARPFGPHQISQGGQVHLPKGLVKHMGWDPREELYFTETDLAPGCVLMVPAALATEWWTRGQTAEPGPGSPDTDS